MNEAREREEIVSTPNREWTRLPVVYNADRLSIGDYQVMMDWERPYMQHMAALLRRHGASSVLEVGFGMGISAEALQQLGIEHHTIIEAHPDVMARARVWRESHPRSSIELIEGFWQDVVVTQELGPFNGIFFDTYSTTRAEADKKKFHFFRVASERLLAPGGALTFCYFNEFLEESYQRELYKYFSRLVVEQTRIAPPADCDYVARVDARTLCVVAIK